MLATTIDELITGIVSTIGAAVNYKVYDGVPSKLPETRIVTQYLVIGAENLDNREAFTSSAHMEQAWAGLGAVARDETVFIDCVAVGIAKSIAGARANATAVLNDVKTNLPTHPTSNSYNALIEQVVAVRSLNVQGGAIVQMQFIITAKARITDA